MLLQDDWVYGAGEETDWWNTTEHATQVIRELVGMHERLLVERGEKVVPALLAAGFPHLQTSYLALSTGWMGGHPKCL